MESNTPKLNIARMANILQIRKQTQTITALFLGAKAGGLFRSSQLYKMLSLVAPNDLYSLAPLERYHQCYNILSDSPLNIQDINHILEDKTLLQEVQAEKPELCIAKLAQQDFFNPILSVSIYREFEEAFQQVGMKELHDFVVDWPKRGLGTSRIHIDKRYLFTLTKVFGDIAAKDYTIRGRVRYLEENQGLRNLINDLRDVNLLIVGVDQVWDRHIIQTLFPRSGSVWYVNDEEPPKNSALSDYLKDSNAEFILGTDGNYENFFKSLCGYITGTVVPASQVPMAPETGAVPTSQSTVVAETMQPVQYHSCFISYSSKDEILAHRLHDDLQKQGVRCWFAPKDMKIGDKIRSRIDEEILLQDKLLLLLSEHSLESTWVEAEVEAALEREQRQQRLVLFPVRLDESVMQTNQAWAALLRRTRHIGDFTRWTDSQAYQQAFDRLLGDLKA